MGLSVPPAEWSDFFVPPTELNELLGPAQSFEGIIWARRIGPTIMPMTT